MSPPRHAIKAQQGEGTPPGWGRKLSSPLSFRAPPRGRPPVLHVCCERDVGLFSLVQQVTANVPWAFQEGRLSVADFRHRTCYSTPSGYRDRDSVWEYYFEPIVAQYPAAAIPERLRAAMEQRFPVQTEPGYVVDGHAYISNNFGDHLSVRGKGAENP
jgi:hypothetical protein